ncbi:MAG: hypothetical protein ABR887_05345 [Methanoregulaceae archaeon]|jgi:hypothetical protein
MINHLTIPHLLEQLMQESKETERWITVREIRDRFHLTRYQCATISGFFRRLERGKFNYCPYIIKKIDRTHTTYGTGKTRVYRYLVTKRF